MGCNEVLRLNDLRKKTYKAAKVVVHRRVGEVHLKL